MDNPDDAKPAAAKAAAKPESVKQDSNVIYAPFRTRLDIPAERVLRSALEDDLQDVVICGRDKDGNTYYASSMSDGAEILWLLERMKKTLLEETS